MATELHAYAKSRKDGRIYLEGIATGEIDHYYCIEYATGSGHSGSVGNDSRDYTYFKRTATSGHYDMSDNGCYIPDHGDDTYRIYLNEVEVGGCDTILGWTAWSIYAEDLPHVEGGIFGMDTTSLVVGAITGATIAIVGKELMT